MKLTLGPWAAGSSGCPGLVHRRVGRELSLEGLGCRTRGWKAVYGMTIYVFLQKGGCLIP